MSKFCKLITSLALLIFGFVNLSAQVDPTPFSLSSGTYSFDSWANTNPAGTFPPNSLFRMVSSTDAPNNTPTILGNYNLAYNVATACRVMGVGTLTSGTTTAVTTGFAFQNTGSLSANAAIDPVNSTIFSAACGIFDVALNASGIGTINVNWTGVTTFANGRIFNLELMYRIGNTGAFTSAGASQIYQSSASVVVGTATQVMPQFTLPSNCDNQPVVQLRWVYYYVSGSGNRPALGLTGLRVFGTPLTLANKLGVSNITIPTQIYSNIPFTGTVQGLNGAFGGVMPSNTNITVTVWGNSGTQTIPMTINSGQSSNTFSCTYNGTGAINVIARDNASILTQSDVANFNVAQSPNSFVIENLYTKGYTVANHPNFNIRAIDANNNTVSGFGGLAGLVTFQNTSNTLQNQTLNVTPTSGTATITNFIFNNSGTFNVFYRNNGINSNTITVVINTFPTVNELLVPRYIVGRNDAGVNTRMATYALIEFTNLHPNTTYRYTTGNRSSTYTLYDDGASNNIHFNEVTGKEYYNSQKGGALSLTGCDLQYSDVRTPYSVFRTGPGQTNKKIWIGVVASGNAAYTIGEDVKYRFNLYNEDGALIQFYTSTQFTRNVSWDVNALTSGATAAEKTRMAQPEFQVYGVYDNLSPMTAGNFVAFYSDSDPTRPLTIARVQGDNNTLNNVATSSATINNQVVCVLTRFEHDGPNFVEAIDGTRDIDNPYIVRNEKAGAWATFLPRRVVQQGSSIILNASLNTIREFDKSGNNVSTYTDPDGIWEDDNTNNNPTFTRTSPMNFETPYVKILGFQGVSEICNRGSINLKFIARGVNSVNVELLDNQNNVTALFTNVTPSVDTNSINWVIPRNNFVNKDFRLRVTSSDYAWTTDITSPFRIFDEIKLYTQTQKAINCYGETRSLGVTADGSNITYQWTKDGISIPSATNSSLVLSNLTFKNSGEYNCIIGGSNICGGIQSQNIVLIVESPTQISNQPKTQTTSLNGNVIFNFDVHAYGLSPDYSINIQWYRGNTPFVDNDRISGSKTNFLTIKNIQTNDYSISDDIYAIVTARCGSATTTKVSIIKNYIDFVKQPESKNSCSNDVIDLEIDFIENVTGLNLAYQWYKDNQALIDGPNISGSKSKKLNLTASTKLNSGNYYCKITLLNNNTEISSNIAKINVTNRAFITKQPIANLNVQADKPFQLFVEATGDSLNYQWQYDGLDIAGANSATFSRDKAKQNDAGDYTVVVSNSCGNVTSSPTKVAVTQQLISSVELEEVIDYLLTPNPTNGEVNFSYNMNKPSIIRVTLNNSVGSTITQLFYGLTQIGSNNLKFNINDFDLANGTYFITLSSDNTTKAVRFIVSK